MGAMECVICVKDGCTELCLLAVLSKFIFLDTFHSLPRLTHPANFMVGFSSGRHRQ